MPESTQQSASTSQSIFVLIRAEDVTGIEALLTSDPMLVYSRLYEPDAEYERRYTPLQVAAEIGNLEVCQLLVKRGAEVYTNPSCSYPPVILAHWKTHKHLVDYFLNEIPKLAAGTNQLGVTINLAGRCGWIDIVRRHIEFDPLSVHYRGWIGDTPLHWPAHNGYIDIVKLLLEHGADPRQQENNWIGGTPLHWASERHPEICKLLIDAGTDVNAQVDRPGSHHLGGTPLHWCARQRDDCAEVIELLLANGADGGLLDAAGKTALDWALELKHNRVAGALAGR